MPALCGAVSLESVWRLDSSLQSTSFDALGPGLSETTALIATAHMCNENKLMYSACVRASLRPPGSCRQCGKLVTVQYLPGNTCRACVLQQFCWKFKASVEMQFSDPWRPWLF